MFFKTYHWLWKIALLLLNAAGLFSRPLKEQLKERGFGKGKTNFDGDSIWFHCASLGEAKGMLAAVLPLNFSRQNLIITATTKTAVGFLREHQSKITKCNRIHIQLAPFDYKPILQAWFTHFNIKNVLIYEMELWPGLLNYCGQHSIPVYWIAARFTKKARQIYLLFPKIFNDVIKAVCWAQTPGDKNQIPVNLNNVSHGIDYKISWYTLHAVNPNLQMPRRDSPNQIQGIGMLSLHLEELTRLRDFIKWAAKKYSLLIFPRYISHSPRFLKTLDNLGFNLYSRFPQSRLLIVDSLGKIPLLSTKFELSVIGGTFCSTGGHSFWESFALNKFCLCGPNCWAQSDALKLLGGKGLALRLKESARIITSLKEIRLPPASSYDSLRSQFLESYKYSSAELAEKLAVETVFETNGPF